MLLSPITVIYQLDLTIQEAYLHATSEPSMSRLSKVTALQSHVTTNITMSYSQVVHVRQM